MTRRLAILACAFAPFEACAADVRVDLPDRQGLAFSAPDSWRSQIQRSRADVPPTIMFASENKRDLVVLVTAMWPMSPGFGGPTEDEIRSLVQDAADGVKAQAVEASLKIVDLAAPEKVGYYFSATDRKPEPNGYKYLTQGAMGFGELRITFTILSNVDAESNAQRALAMLRTATRTPKNAP